jgi:hypothetical protein
MSESARFNMVEAQVRASNVTDERILAAMNAVAREKFVPSAAQALAYADVPVAVAPGRYLLDPRSFAKLAQLAGIGPDDRILDVGCGTGYSRRCWRVWAPKWWPWNKMPIWYVLPAAYWQILWARLNWCRVV